MKIEVGGSCINNKHKATSLSEVNFVGSLCSIRKRNLNKLVVALHNICTFWGKYYKDIFINMLWFFNSAIGSLEYYIHLCGVFFF